MKKYVVVLAGLVTASLASVGCSVTGAAMTAGRMGMNANRTDSHLTIKLDGKPATQDMFKKTVTGHANYTVNGETSSAPTLNFEISDPASFGRITKVMVSIHQKFEADYSHQAEFTVVAANTNDPQAQMKPGVNYELSNPGPAFKVYNLTNQQVSGVQLTPGKEYMLSLTVVADRSETAQVYFKAGGSSTATTASQTTHQ
ncbi:MAG: hypothetical protein U1D55_01450 [Phycisphaerae bacterium]